MLHADPNDSSSVRIHPPTIFEIHAQMEFEAWQRKLREEMKEKKTEKTKQ